MEYEVTVAAGNATEPEAYAPTEITFDMPNPRADTATIAAAFTGGHLLHLAVAACVVNDIYREAQRMGIAIDAVSVSARGGFAGSPVVSTGITYSVDVSSPAGADEVGRLIAHVDEIAEIPNTLKRSTIVTNT